MLWFKSSSKKPKEFRVARILFVGEQDGPPEQLLKCQLIQFFRRDRSVHKAYLAKVQLAGQDSVALCLKAQFGIDKGLAEKIGGIFGMIFNSHEHLDIMFLSPEQEFHLSMVCSPFFDIEKSEHPV